MKLIIPMAGRGTRVRPHSHTVPKPLLPVAGTMIVERLLETFIRTLDREITEVVYILGPDFGQAIRDELAAMSTRNQVKATFRVQEVALGTAHAVACANEDLDGEVIVSFADTLFDSKEKFNIEEADSVIWLKQVDDPSRFGVAVHEGETITGFVEKPQEFISDLAIIGVYYFKDGKELKRQLQRVMDEDIKGPGGEYFLTEALDHMIKEGQRFKVATVDEWLDCGTLPAWLETTGIITEKEQQNENGHAYPGTTIIPPVFIGPGVTLENCTIGPKVSIEEGAKITSTKLSNTIVRESAEIVNSEIQDSTIGAFTRVERLKGKIDIGDHSHIVLPG
ncbi:MAG: sugar phosphate nucleotidyltransferase [Bacteroidota bacterium]